MMIDNTSLRCFKKLDEVCIWLAYTRLLYFICYVVRNSIAELVHVDSVGS